MLGELTLRDQNLAAAAQSAAPANRIDVDAEAARRLQYRRADGKIPALARGREDDERVSGRHANRLPLSRAAAMAPFTPAARRFAGGRGGGDGGLTRTGTGRRVGETADPARAIGIVPQHHVR